MDQAPVFTGNDPLDLSRLSLNNGIHQGDFFIGPPIHGVNPTTVRNLVEYLAKKDSSDEFMILKVLSTSSDGDSSDDRQGKVLLHNERLILSLLNDQPGVIHHHGLFRDRNHFILVLDCLVAHKYDTNGTYKDYINLQHYVIKKKKLNECEALEMFHNILMTLQVLHAVSKIRSRACSWISAWAMCKSLKCL
jgi:serine/threonine-protein kinase 40